MKRLYLKLFAALIAAGLGLALLLYQQSFLKKSFQTETAIKSSLQSIQHDLLLLQYLTLQTSYFLYFNNDKIFTKTYTIEKTLQQLIDHPLFQKENFQSSAQQLHTFQKKFLTFKDLITQFLTINAALKNSTVYLPTLSLKAFEIFDKRDPQHYQIIQMLTKINARIFLTKSALDSTFMDELKNYHNSLYQIETTLKKPAHKRLLQTALNHLEIFINYFPLFQKDLHTILDRSTLEALHQTMKIFDDEATQNYETLNTVSQLFLLLYLLSILVVLYFIFHSEKENIKLRRTKNALHKSLVVDPLTRLGNRKTYKRDYRNFKHPAMVLFNIDKFKHINEFYGSAIGDAILKQVAQRLQSDFAKDFPEAHFYRLGGDDFAIVFEYQGEQHLHQVIEKVLELFNNQTFSTNGVSVDITISIGASYTDKLFETADMALKYAKQSRRERYAIYNPTLDTSDIIAKNIKELKQLNQAIKVDAIIPYFQPIFDLQTNQIVKYESLARLRISVTEVLTPFHFLHAAKEAKLSSLITSVILEKTLEKARITQQAFSVNISSGDIDHAGTQQMIIPMLSRFRDVAHLITFEILESEEIEDYDLMFQFIQAVKEYGCQIAIDDFGSGYSNFEKLLKMDIDLLKIDGTLIRDIDHDQHAEMVVTTICNFAKKAGIRTVAEYVHSQEVLEKVKALGIEMGQGFYLGKPEPDIITHKE
ncbi:MAG: hypothetical protein DSY46_00405 [Hydrogenimonas sp.]|nr:MAG: hypothetical protein DSY46_00405 [Hydrogenimonas sp.]